MTDDEQPKNRAGNRRGMSAGSRKTTYKTGDEWNGNPGGIPKSARRLRKMSRYAAGLAIQEMATRLEQDPESIDGAALPKYAKVLADYGGYMSDKDQAQLMIQAAAARAHFKKADGSYDEDAFHRFVLVTMGHAPKQLMAADDTVSVAQLGRAPQDPPCTSDRVQTEDAGSTPAADPFTTVDTPYVDGSGPALEPDSGANEDPTAAGVGQFSLEDE